MSREVVFFFEKKKYYVTLDEGLLQPGKAIYISAVCTGLKGQFKIEYVAIGFPTEIGVRKIGEIPLSVSNAACAYMCNVNT